MILSSYRPTATVCCNIHDVVSPWSLKTVGLCLRVAGLKSMDPSSKPLENVHPQPRPIAIRTQVTRIVYCVGETTPHIPDITCFRYSAAVSSRMPSLMTCGLTICQTLEWSWPRRKLISAGELILALSGVPSTRSCGPILIGGRFIQQPFERFIPPSRDVLVLSCRQITWGCSRWMVVAIVTIKCRLGVGYTKRHREHWLNTNLQLKAEWLKQIS